jgi:hypothetical protein
MCNGYWKISYPLADVFLHRLGVGVRHRDRCALFFCGTDDAEEMGVSVTLVGGLTRPRALASDMFRDACVDPAVTSERGVVRCFGNQGFTR